MVVFVSVFNESILCRVKHALPLHNEVVIWRERNENHRRGGREMQEAAFMLRSFFLSREALAIIKRKCVEKRAGGRATAPFASRSVPALLLLILCADGRPVCGCAIGARNEVEICRLNEHVLAPIIGVVLACNDWRASRGWHRAATLLSGESAALGRGCLLWKAALKGSVLAQASER